MTKRFDWDLNGIWDYQSDSDEYLESSKEICELLNELHEENQQYQEWLDALREELSLADRDNTTLEKENRTLKLLVQNWEQLDDEKDEQLEKMNDSLKRLVEENKQLQQELFESEYENICERYYDNPIRRDSYVEDLKEEFKERFGRDFERLNLLLATFVKKCKE